MSSATEEFRAARDFLLEHRDDYAGAAPGFAWPRPEHFNFALDWFDGVLAAEHPERSALQDHRGRRQRAGLHLRRAVAAAPTRSPGGCAAHGVERGMRVLLLLGNQVELWECMLAAMKLGAVIIPATTLLAEADLPDRLDRGDVAPSSPAAGWRRRFAGLHGSYTRIAVGAPVEGWLRYDDTLRQLRRRSSPDGPTTRRRSAAALLHLGHDRAAQAGRAHPRQLPDRAPVDDVLDRPAARATST